jgi:hypothetical protein
MAHVRTVTAPLYALEVLALVRIDIPPFLTAVSQSIAKPHGWRG